MGEKRPVVVQVPSAHSSRTWAAIVSLFAPGTGHLLYGHRIRGIAWAAVAIVAPLVLAHVGGPVYSSLLGVRLLAIIDVMLLKRSSPARALVIAVGALQLGLLGFGFVRAFGITKIPSSSMMPTHDEGDRVVIDRLAFVLGRPHRGDVVAFDYPCADMVYFKRIVALGGDTVEVRCGVLFVSGRAVERVLVEDGARCTYRDFDEGQSTWRDRRCSRYRETLEGVPFETFQAPELPAHPGVPDEHDFPGLRETRPPYCDAQYRERPPENVIVGTLAGSPTSNPCSPQLRYRVPEDHVFVLGDNRANSHDSRYWGAVPTSSLRGRIHRFW